MTYYKYSTQLKDRFGEKVYKIPINVPGTCPNRDGTVGTNGCIFCGESGAGFESLVNTVSIQDQLKRNMDYIGPKYNASKFIAYFQNYTGTYIGIDVFKKNLESACIDSVVGFSVSTRPDCVDETYLDCLEEFHNRGYHIDLELGLQSININTLNMLNRGHGLADFVDAALRIKAKGFSLSVHLIGNLPWDTEDDFYEAARLFNVLNVDSVKIHSLYILKDTRLGDWYDKDMFDIIPPAAYIKRVIHFLRLLNPRISVQRLFARAPEDESLFCNWETSWRKLQNQLDDEMEKLHYKQGDLCHK